MAKKPGFRFCSNCHESYPATGEHFFRHKERKDGLHSWCKSCCKEGNKRSIEKKYSTFEGRITTFLRTCKESAKKRNQEFSLERQDFLEMWDEQQGLCVYTGLPMELQPNTLFSVSVERVDNSVGYTKNNTVLVTNAVNRMKSNMEGEDFFHFCKCVTLWLSNKKLELDVEFDKYA
jgi:hypothetical protein